MAFQFKFESLSGFQDIENFYQEFADQLLKEYPHEAEFDLEIIDFITPEALLSLLCASQHWKIKKGSPVKWIVNEQVLAYLERVDVMRVFADAIVFDKLPDERWTRSSSLSLMEICEISPEPEQNSHDVSNTITTASHFLLGRVTTKQLGSASTLLSEITQNVIHSRSIGYAFAQAYNANQGSRVHLGVIDIGAGIATTLSSKYPDVAKPSDYLRLSLESGITSSSSSNGLGLFQVRNIVQQGKGILVIRSGTALLQIHNERFYQWDDLAEIPGTQVYIAMWGSHEKGKWEYPLS